MITPFGVEYRDISKAELKLGDKEKAGIAGAAAVGGAYVGHEAILRPDYWYNETVHKPWFEYQKSTAMRQRGISKDPKERAAARAQAGRIETDAKSNYEREKAKRSKPVDVDASVEGQRKAHEAKQAKIVASGKEATPFDEKTVRERMAANAKPAEEMKPFALSDAQKKARADLENKGRKHLQPTRMTAEQGDKFVEYTEKPPTKRLRSKYRYKPPVPQPKDATDQQKAETVAENKKRAKRIGPLQGRDELAQVQGLLQELPQRPTGQ